MDKRKILLTIALVNMIGGVATMVATKVEAPKPVDNPDAKIVVIQKGGGQTELELSADAVISFSEGNMVFTTDATTFTVPIDDIDYLSSSVTSDTKRYVMFITESDDNVTIVNVENIARISFREKKGNVKYTAGDIVVIAKTIADGGYSANYNVNGDDRVDIADAIKIADAIIEGTNGDDDDEQSYTTCPDGNHPHMIDLGLPSGLMWACCNVGAETPEGYGGYYAWGETEEKEKYDWETYKWCNGSSTTLTKYNNSAHNGGVVDNLTTLELSDDVAYVMWGAPWQIPTYFQISELMTKCTSEYKTRNGVVGREFIGPNGNKIFLPYAGMDGSSYYAGKRARYWSSTLNTQSNYTAWSSYCLELGDPDKVYDSRFKGYSVRPVCEPTAIALSRAAADGEKRYKMVIEKTDDTEVAVNVDGIAPITFRETGIGGPQSYTDCPDDNHPHLIDLGLPSGTMWACCNVGAEAPEGYGGYYAWGETKLKEEYDWETYKWCNGSDNRITKYNPNGNNGGVIDDKTTLELSDDAASVRWGSPWRTPTSSQISELMSKCTSEATTRNGVNGREFTGPNGAKIFLPYAGEGGSSYNAGKQGRYWSSTLNTQNAFSSWSSYCLEFVNPGKGYASRSKGYSVRPVCGFFNPCPDGNHPHMIDLGLPSGTKWACCNVGAAKPEEHGGYYAWGETEEKDEYDWDNYKWGTAGSINKYAPNHDNYNIYSFKDGKGTLDPEDDVAYVKWGTPWRIPTYDQMDELITYCTWERTDLNGVNVWKVTGVSSEHNCIYLPASGYRLGTSSPTTGKKGYYWTSDIWYDNEICRFLYFTDVIYTDGDTTGRRAYGFTVRPVHKD